MSNVKCQMSMSNFKCQKSNVKCRDEKWKRGDTRLIDEHLTFVQRLEILVSCSVKVNIPFLSKVMHEQRQTTRQSATNQPHVASAGPVSQYVTFYSVSKVSLDF